MFQVLTDPKLSWQEKQKYYTVLRSSSDRLVKTVTDYLDIALIVSGNMVVNESVFAPVILLDEIYTEFWQTCEARHLTITLNHLPSPGVFQIKSDHAMLRKVLSHLIDNAIKFTDKGTVSCGFEIKGDEVEFFVRDTGVGIDKEAQARIYDLFIQENVSINRGQEGSGLGLSIIRGLLKLLGGENPFGVGKDKGAAFFLFRSDSNGSFLTGLNREKQHFLALLHLKVIFDRSIRPSSES